jgi:2-polyprenyl-3-methyl-5-hydroxy-6-metoxy-1,4-benzoquinol methylase
MAQKSHCNVCGSPENIPLFSTIDYISRTSHTLVKCKSCGLTYVSPQPTKEELSSFYPNKYYGTEPFLYEKADARSRFKMLHKTLGERRGRLLDVGCGKGLLLKLFKDSGWQVTGTELSEHSAQYARETLGIAICSEDIEKCNFQDQYFDVITLFHSLEHLMDPTSWLKTVKRLLKPNGLLIIQVPRFNSFYSKIFKNKWFHLDVPRHLFHFDDNTLENLLSAASFRVFEKKRYVLMHDSFGALQSILNCVCSEYNLLNDINTKRKSVKEIMNSPKKRLKIDLIISLLSQVFLFPLLFVLAAFLSIFNIGGTLTYYATKK